MGSYRVDHIPFRSWCPFCIKGRGTGLQHRRIKLEDRIPVFGFDYLLDAHAIQDDQQEEIKILAAKCQYTKCVFAHAVPQKGFDPKLYAVDRLRRRACWSTDQMLAHASQFV